MRDTRLQHLVACRRAAESVDALLAEFQQSTRTLIKAMAAAYRVSTISERVELRDTGRQVAAHIARTILDDLDHFAKRIPPCLKRAQ